MISLSSSLTVLSFASDLGMYSRFLYHYNITIILIIIIIITTVRSLTLLLSKCLSQLECIKLLYHYIIIIITINIKFNYHHDDHYKCPLLLSLVLNSRWNVYSLFICEDYSHPLCFINESLSKYLHQEERVLGQFSHSCVK